MIKARKRWLRMKITATKKGTWPLPNDASAVHRVSRNTRIERTNTGPPAAASSEHLGGLMDGLTLVLLLKGAEWKLLME